MIEDGVLIAYIGSEEDVVIPESVTYIGEDAFKWCGISIRCVCYCTEGSYTETYMKEYYPQIRCQTIIDSGNTQPSESEVTESETETPKPSESEDTESETETPRPSESEATNLKSSETES